MSAAKGRRRGRYEPLTNAIPGSTTLFDYSDEMQAYWLGRGTCYDLSGTLPLLRETGRVTVYRSVPADIVEAVEIRPGDYVSTSRAYAGQHACANLGGHLGRKHRVLKKTVGLDELEPADGPCEFWYRPRRQRESGKGGR